jgi:DUF4097 and DUF4098 domain-containing protein YvlB
MALTASAQVWWSHTAQEEHTFTVGGMPHVRLSTFDGAIRVESWDRAEVRYTAEKRGRTQADLDRIEIEAVQDGDAVQIDARLRNRHWSWHASVTLTVWVPRQTNLSARSGDGQIEARDVTGEIELVTGDGRIAGTGLSGNLSIRTGDGAIELLDLSGRLRARTGDGRLHLRGRFEELEATTGDGGMEINVERGSRMNTAWRLTTGDGSVQLSLPDDFSADLDVHTNDGTISTDLPVTVSGRLGNTLRGRLNQGGNTLTVRTGDGSIALRRS